MKKKFFYSLFSPPPLHPFSFPLSSSPQHFRLLAIFFFPQKLVGNQIFFSNEFYMSLSSFVTFFIQSVILHSFFNSSVSEVNGKRNVFVVSFRIRQTKFSSLIFFREIVDVFISNRLIRFSADFAVSRLVFVFILSFYLSTFNLLFRRKVACL